MIKSGVVIIALFVGTGAAAQPIRTEQITYADLNLGRPEAQSMLENRIRAAASRVCDLGGMQALEEFSSSTHCYRIAVSQGYHQMDQLIAANRVGVTVAASAITVTAR